MRRMEDEKDYISGTRNSFNVDGSGLRYVKCPRAVVLCSGQHFGGSGK